MLFYPSATALIFDLDGTLWDASKPTARAWTKVAQQFAFKTLPDEALIKTVSGLTFHDCIQRIFGDRGESISEPAALQAALKRAEYEELLATGGELYPGVAEGLKRLQEVYQLFLVSNCHDWYLEVFFKHTGLKTYFKDFLCFGHTGLSKKDNIIQLLERNFLHSREQDEEQRQSLSTSKVPAIYIGDTHWDQEAAYGAGVGFIFSQYGFGKPFLPAPSITSFGELVTSLLSE